MTGTDDRQSTPIEMVEQLHRAVYGNSWARPETPEQVWTMLLQRVRGLAAARAALESAVGGKVTRMDQEELTVERWHWPEDWMDKDVYVTTADARAIALGLPRAKS